MIKLSAEAIIRSQARKALQNNYSTAVIGIVILLLPLFIYSGFESVVIYLLPALISYSSISNIVSLFSVMTALLLISVFLSPLMNGFIRMFYVNCCTGKMDIKDVFFYMSKDKYVKTLHLNLSFVLRMLIPGLLAYSPVVLYVILIDKLYSDLSKSFLYNDFYLILFILSTMILVLWSLKYFLVFTLYAENESVPVNKLFTLSKSIMKSHSASASKLIFSYAPWMLLSFLILPLIYVVPYMTQGLCIGAKWMTRTSLEVK